MALSDVLQVVLSGLILILLIAVFIALRRQAGGDAAAALAPLMQQSGERMERLERALRDEMGRGNSGLRQELLGDVVALPAQEVGDRGDAELQIAEYAVLVSLRKIQAGGERRRRGSRCRKVGRQG